MTKPPAPKFERPLYDVLYSHGEKDRVERVAIRHGDRLRAEREAHKAGLPPLSNAHAQAHVTVMCWAALVREGKYDKSYGVFIKDDMQEIEAVVVNGVHVKEQVGPTRPDLPTTTG